MRFTAFFPLLCSILALILAFLSLFAGSKPNMMERYDLMTLNTSRIGFDFLFKNSSSTAPSNDRSFLGSLIDDGKNEIRNVTNNLEKDIREGLNKALRSIAKDLGLYDYYSLHVQGFCEGMFQPNGTSNRNVSSCSNTTGTSSFSPRTTLQQQLDKSSLDITLDDLQFPDVIEDTFQALKLAFTSTFYLYCIGIIFTGLAIFSAAAGMFTQDRVPALLNIGLSGLSFLALLIASALVTYAATRITNLVNREGKVVNITAMRGDRFIALTWASTSLCFIATAAWLGECIIGRRKAMMTPKQYQ